MRNEQSSGPTSRSEPRYKIELSEADYLAREVEDAKAALARTLAELKNGLSTSANLRLWVKHYPWAALGAASVAGFAAATAITPAAGESLSEKMSRLKSNVRESTPSDNGRPAGEAEKSSRVKATLMDSIFDLAKTLVQTVLLATLQGQAAAGSQTQTQHSAVSGEPR